MINFAYSKPASAKAAIDAVAKDAGAKFIAGGTNLVDLMKRGVQTHEKLVDISRLPLTTILRTGSVIRIGALARNSAVAADPLVRERLPLLAQALEAGASAQIRNMATVGGNLLQRTRCPYFYDTSFPCNKRAPGTGCSALKGYNRMHAIFGASEQCIAVHPSDMAVALAAMDATVVAQGPKGERRILMSDFHRLPGNAPQVDTNLQRNELITSIEIPDRFAGAATARYVKIRDRASYAFALVSVAAYLPLNGKGAASAIRGARIALGGVAHRPWRLKNVESFLEGKLPSRGVFTEAASLAIRDAKAYEHNRFKIKMLQNALADTLLSITNPQTK